MEVDAIDCSVKNDDDDDDDDDVDDECTDDYVLDGGAECFGGTADNVLDIATGSKMPLEQTVKYMGIQGTCDTSVDESIDAEII
jgi:hypothetical protein